MVLELGTFPVTDVVLGRTTGYRDGVLTVNSEELRDRLLPDHHFVDITVDVVKPGDSVRVHNILDVVEPRVRVSEPGTDFPGMLCAAKTVGSGRTHRLSGIAVCELSNAVPGEPVYWRQALLDASGPGAAYSPFGSLINLVLTFQPNLAQFSKADPDAYDVLAGTPEVVAYNDAVRKAGFSTAVYLAETVAELEPKELTTYDTSLVDPQPGLARVVYFLQGRPYVYGETMRVGSGGPGHLPTFIHPNEVFDGAVTNSWISPACHRDVTYLIQNHPVIEDLYRDHGKSIDFAGVIIYDRGDDAHRKERNAYWAAKMASLAKADGALLTYLGSGHSIVDIMMIVEILEKQGVKTVPLLPEMAGDPRESGLADFVPEAEAIVSTGNYELPIELPSVSKVLGGDSLLETGEDAAGPLSVTLRSLLASTDPYGFGFLRAREW